MGSLTFRDHVGKILSSRSAQWLVVILFILITILKDDLAYFLGIIFVLLLLWSRKWDWSLIGLLKPKSWRKVWIQALIWSLLILVIVDIIITPFVEIIFHQNVDLTGLDGIRGNFLNYAILILFMWVIAAFGEEFIYRGLLVNRLGILLGNSKAALWIAVIISSLLFGLAHKYQGISGMISTGSVVFILGALFINSKNKLWLTILTHGIYDVIGITLIYLNIENDIYGLLKNLIIS